MSISDIRKYKSDKQREYRAAKRKSGLCYDCSKKIDTPGRSRCDSCYDKKQTHDAMSYYLRRSGGMCARCGSKEAVTAGIAARCMDCFFKDTAHKASRRTSDKIDWKIIRKIWEDQNGICPFTGIKLTPALDAELDHINPVSRCASPNDPENLRWVYYRVNHAKYDMTDSEFFEFISMLNERMEDINGR